MKIVSLSNVDSTIYKGLAIMMIMLHNYLHVFPLPKENEFSFNREYFDAFLTLLLSEPESIIRITFSYFGHYGVQIFVFLSAYGLAIKYLDKRVKYRLFVFERLWKIYPAFLLSLAAWFTLRAAWYSLNGTLGDADFKLEAVILKLTLFPNVFPNYALSPVGPWWFLPFIFQFYLVLPLLLRLYASMGNKFLIVVSISSFIASIAIENIGYTAIYYNIPPYMPIFCFGIYLAKISANELRVSPFVLLSVLNRNTINLRAFKVNLIFFTIFFNLCHFQ